MQVAPSKQRSPAAQHATPHVTAQNVSAPTSSRVVMASGALVASRPASSRATHMRSMHSEFAGQSVALLHPEGGDEPQSHPREAMAKVMEVKRAIRRIAS